MKREIKCKLYYQHNETGRIVTKIVKFGESIPWLGEEYGGHIGGGEYTELKDKNGKEIYEGDVICVPENYEGDNLYKSFIGEIRFDAPEFYVNQSANISKTGKWCGQDYSWDELEIIGNIYENFELIDKENDE